MATLVNKTVITVIVISIVGHQSSLHSERHENTYKFNFVSQLAKQYKDGWLFTGRQESLLLMSLRVSAASMATIQTTTSPPTHQVTKSTSPSSPTHTRDLPPKSSWHSARSLQPSRQPAPHGSTPTAQARRTD